MEILGTKFLYIKFLDRNFYVDFQILNLSIIKLIETSIYCIEKS